MTAVTKPDRIVILTHQQWRELASVLWECCAETEDGIKTLREDLPLADVWRAVVDARTIEDVLKSI